MWLVVRKITIYHTFITRETFVVVSLPKQSQNPLQLINGLQSSDFGWWIWTRECPIVVIGENIFHSLEAAFCFLASTPSPTSLPPLPPPPHPDFSRPPSLSASWPLSVATVSFAFIYYAWPAHRMRVWVEVTVNKLMRMKTRPWASRLPFAS